MAIKPRSPTAFSSSVAPLASPQLAIFSGKSIVHGIFLTVGGSSFLKPSSICAIRGKKLSRPASLVGSSFCTKVMFLAMAVIAPETVPPWTFLP
jgi:hypothetical protein